MAPWISFLLLKTAVIIEKSIYLEIMTICRLCEGQVTPSFKHKILGKYDVQYYSCKECGYFQTEAPYWLEEAYTQVINSEDNGIFRRNYFLSGFLRSSSARLFADETKEPKLDSYKYHLSVLPLYPNCINETGQAPFL